MALSPVTASRTTRLEVAPGPSFAASTLCIVQISVLLGRLVSIRAGSSQARVGMECPGRVARRSVALENPIPGPVRVALASLFASCPGPCRTALCRCHHVSLPVFPLSSCISLAVICMVLSFSFLCFSLSLTPVLCLLPLQLPTPLSQPTSNGISPQISGDGSVFFPFLPQTVPSMNAQPVLRAPACPAAPFLGHTAGTQVHGAERRVEWGGGQRSS